ncbi:hypothetical protein [Legionella yabuuchiae]|uniref:hypothetical protein n=1 Tax=Legionella yabuuchiae TaxID=376727 RepID=UPI001055352B|nr:hypothetical protein [Legionella yabuuchiae]
MPEKAAVLDEKNNLVFVTLFESYLAKFVLEHPEFYSSAYKKLLISLERLLNIENETLQRILSTKPHSLDLDRVLFSIFSQLKTQYSRYDSLLDVVSQFHLPAADYLVKLLTDHIFTPATSITIHSFAQMSMFKPIDDSSARRSPYNPSRSSLLFHERNRGVLEKSSEFLEEEEGTQTLGIVSDEFAPKDLIDYFEKPIYPARNIYKPNEESYVAKWLRQRSCPVISGASGSTEALLARIFPLIPALTSEERKIILFAQACNMIANGHHSFFETMIVADSFGYKLEDKPSLLEFYLQCVPESILSSEVFQDFLASEAVQSLPMNKQMTPTAHESEDDEALCEEIARLTAVCP